MATIWSMGIALVCGCWLFVAACGSSEGMPDGAPPTGDDAATVHEEGEVAANGAPRLSATHPGWKQPLCNTCHTPATLASQHSGESYQVPTCVSCHGWNGAVHRDHAADPAGQCAECHSSGVIVSDHLANFTAPRDCATCHVHPQSPEGL